MLPTDFSNRMKKILGTDFEKFGAAFSEPPVRSFRVNTNKICKENFEKSIRSAENKFPMPKTDFTLTATGSATTLTITQE